jgi:hypothetical protein
MPRRLLLFAALVAPLVAAPLSAQGSADALTGSWLVTLTPPNRGEVVVRMRFAADGAGKWHASSRTGAARQFAPWWKYHFGRLTGKVPSGGSLAYIQHGSGAGGAALRGELRSPILGNFFVAATRTAGEIAGELRRDSLGPVVGSIRAVRDTPGSTPRGYSTLARAIRTTLSDNVFDPRLAASPRWRSFFDDVDKAMAGAHDDLDALAAFYSRLPRLRISHISLVRDPALARLPLDSLLTRIQGPPDSLVRVRFPAPGVVYIGVTKWDQVTHAVERAFRRLDSARAHTLVLDMRGNPGGDNSAGSVFSHVFPDSTFAGAFVTRRWFASHAAPPTNAEQGAFPLITRDEGMEIIHTMRANAGVRVAAVPRSPYFGGKMYVLIDGRTGSASEPVAYHLKASGRATLVGQRTGGAVLTALPHDLGDGWVLVLPESDYYAADGTRLEGNGVTPHVEAPSSEALLAAAAEIARDDRLAGTVLRTSTLIALQRWRAAVSAYRDVVAIGGVRANLRTNLERALQQYLVRVPDDAEALTAQRELATVRRQ